MSELISLTDIESNQILIWSDIEQAFINVTPNATILNIDTITHQPLSPNANFIANIDTNTIRTRGIVGGENVTITQTGTDIIIDVSIEGDSDAETLSGFTHLQFVKKTELNNLIDLNFIVDNLDVYTTSESHDQFMETNASNIPDRDNTYDLGSNGRRYADVYAKTFHGTATNAMFSQKLSKLGANENDVLTWKGDDWTPMPLGSISITNLDDVTIDNVINKQLLSFDSISQQWVNVNPQDVIPLTNLQFNNSGQGEEVLNEVIGNTVRFRTLEANTGIILSSDDNSIHVQVDDDHIDDLINYKLNEVTTDTFENIFDIDISNDNTMLVWDEGKIVNRPIPVGGGGDTIDASNASEGQVLSFDGIKLVFVDPYNPLDDIDVTGAIDGYVLTYNGTGYELREQSINTDTLGMVDTSTAINGDVLVWNGNQYTLSNVNTLDNIDTDGVINGYVVTFEDGEFVLREPVSIGITLDDLDSSAADDGFYVAYNGISYELRELPSDNNTDNDTLGDVIVTGATTGDVVTWDGDGYILSTPNDTLNEIDTTSAVSGYYVAFNGVGYELRQLPEGSGINTDLLADVDTTNALSGDVLIWNGTNYVLDTITSLSDIDVSTAQNGYILTYENGTFVLSDIPVINDLLSEVDTSTATTGDVLTWDGNGYVLSSITDNDTLGDVDFTSAQDGYYVAFNGNGYELRQLPEGSGTNTDLLADVDTTNAVNGDVLIWNGTSYVLSDITTLDDIDVSSAVNGYVITYQDGSFVLSENSAITDSLSEVDTTAANIGDTLTWNGTDYVLTTPTDSDTLGDVDTTTANNGDILTFENGGYVLRTPNVTGDTLSEIDVSVANDGDYVAYNTTTTEYELRSIPINTDTLNGIDTSTATNGDVLTWNGTEYTLNVIPTPSLSLNDLTDVVIDNPLQDQVLAWDGTQFSLQTISTGGGATSLNDLSDVDGTVTPNDGDVLTYNSTKSQYEPLPFVGGTGGTKYEILRVNYNASNNYDSVEYLTDNLEVVSVIDSDLVLLEVKFSNYTFPPLSIGYWGYVYTENMYRFINVTTAVSDMSISGVGTVGSPTLFDQNRAVKEYNMSVSVRTNESQASASDGFPPQPTHAYVVFVMGD